MALKPTHLKAVVEVLTSDEFESPEVMAKAAVARLDELRSEDIQYITVREHKHEDGSAYWGTGPYATHAQALKAIEKGAAGIAGAGKVAVVPTFHPSRVARSAADADDHPAYHKGHWALYREAAGI